MKERERIFGKDVRRVFRIGESKAITLPPEFVEAHKIKEGDQLEIVFDNELRAKVVRAEEIKKIFDGGK